MPDGRLPPSPSLSAPPLFSAPSSVLIIGSGVFGLGTAYALARRDVFANTSITVLDRSTDQNSFPSRDASSVDSSRIIRADYADRAYASLAADALVEWRKSADDELGGQGRYTESGLVFSVDQDPTLTVPSPKKTGAGYCLASWQNVAALAKGDASLESKIRLLPSSDAIRDAVGTGGSSGVWGYINQSSGWADADAAMRFLFNQVKKAGRVRFMSGTATSLIHDGKTVSGAILNDGRSLHAELVILATGAWTGGLIDLASRVAATAEALAYLNITDEEQAHLSAMPVLMNLSTGLFIIPPSNNVLKVARHEYGYLNPTTSISPLRTPSNAADDGASNGEPYTISLPPRNIEDMFTAIPESSQAVFRAALRDMIPLPAIHERPFTKTRVCWYSNTQTGDFLVDYHPHWDGLFLATGGNGHAFKFLPVLGERVVDCLTKQRPLDFDDKWAWKHHATTRWNEIVTEDGSRAGEPGLVFLEELNRGQPIDSGHTALKSTSSE